MNDYRETFVIAITPEQRRITRVADKTRELREALNIEAEAGRLERQERVRNAVHGIYNPDRKG